MKEGSTMATSSKPAFEGQSLEEFFVSFAYKGGGGGHNDGIRKRNSSGGGGTVDKRVGQGRRLLSPNSNHNNTPLPPPSLPSLSLQSTTLLPPGERKLNLRKWPSPPEEEIAAEARRGPPEGRRREEDAGRKPRGKTPRRKTPGGRRLGRRRRKGGSLPEKARRASFAGEEAAGFPLGTPPPGAAGRRGSPAGRRREHAASGKDSGSRWKTPGTPPRGRRRRKSR